MNDEPNCVACEGKPAGTNNPCAVCGRAALSSRAAGEVELPPLPTLPQSLLNEISYYGMARTDGKSDGERLLLWQDLISGIKHYAAVYGRAALASKPAAQFDAAPPLSSEQQTEKGQSMKPQSIANDEYFWELVEAWVEHGGGMKRKQAIIDHIDAWRGTAAVDIEEVASIIEGALVDDLLPYHSQEWIARAQALLAKLKS